ncbi:MAG: hypothetical protein CV089_02150 [Nitrospira sp. WS110]|nr:hypothetical protein [Nitrospira sp. WS110]
MQKHTGNLQNQVGAALGGASVYVRDNGTGALSSIFADNGVTPKANPFLTDSNDGSYWFYASNGRYDLTFTKAGYTFDATDTAGIILFDPDESIPSIQEAVDASAESAAAAEASAEAAEGSLNMALDALDLGPNLLYSTDFSSLQELLGEIGPNPTTLLVLNAFPWTGTLQSPENLRYSFVGMGTLEATHPDAELEIFSPEHITAPKNRRIFSANGTITYTRRGVHYPEWYGADPSGTNACHAEVRRAVQAGGSIELNGVYKMGGALAVDVDDTELYGRGPWSGLLADVDMPMMVGIVEYTTGVHLHDFSFIGFTNDEGQINRGLDVGCNPNLLVHSTNQYDARGIILERLHFRGTDDNHGWNVGAYIGLADGVTMRDCVFTHIYGTTPGQAVGVHVDGRYQLLEGNRFIPAIANSMRHGIYFVGTCKYSKAIRNYVRNAAFEGITGHADAGGGIGNEIAQNTVIDCNKQATVANSGAVYYEYAPDLLVHHNFVDSAGSTATGHGMTFYGCERLDLHDNTVKDAPFHAIKVSASGHEARIHSNHLQTWARHTDANLQGVGIDVETSNEAMVYDNVIKSTTARERSAIRKNLTAPASANLHVFNNCILGNYSTGQYENITTKVDVPTEA